MSGDSAILCSSDNVGVAHAETELPHARHKRGAYAYDRVTILSCDPLENSSVTRDRFYYNP